MPHGCCFSVTKSRATCQPGTVVQTCPPTKAENPPGLRPPSADGAPLHINENPGGETLRRRCTPVQTGPTPRWGNPPRKMNPPSPLTQPLASCGTVGNQQSPQVPVPTLACAGGPGDTRRNVSPGVLCYFPTWESRAFNLREIGFKASVRLALCSMSFEPAGQR